MAISKLKKLAQMMPPTPDPTGGMGAMPPMGGAMPPSPFGPMGMPSAMPMVQPMSSPPDRMEITAALDTLGKILYDADVSEMIENNVGDNLDDLAMELWKMYGGDEMGNDDAGKVGARTDKVLEGPDAERERKTTDKRRWERLPEGKRITDIVTFDELTNVMNGLAVGTIKSSAPPQEAPGGVPPMLATHRRHWIRLANILDKIGYVRDADYLDTINL